MSLISTYQLLWLVFDIFLASGLFVVLSESLDTRVYFYDWSLPAHAEVGGKVVLRCHYHRDNVTVLKWYRNNQEFYRHDPMDIAESGVKMENLPDGFSIKKSSAEEVVFDNVTAKTSGNFKCELTQISHPLYHTDVIEKSLTVVELPQRPPTVVVDQTQPDNVSVVCKAAESQPRVKLRWFRNGASVPSRQTEESATSLMLTLTDRPVTLTCTQTVEVFVTDNVRLDKAEYWQMVYWDKASVTVQKNEYNRGSEKSDAAMLVFLLCSLLFCLRNLSSFFTF